MDVASLAALIAAHKWVPLGALLIGAIVAASKQGWAGAAMARSLPSRWIPFLAPFYAATTVGSTELMAGKPWQDALADSVGAVVAGLISVLLHELGIEGLRNGKELIPQKGAPSQ